MYIKVKIFLAKCKQSPRLAIVIIFSVLHISNMFRFFLSHKPPLPKRGRIPKLFVDFVFFSPRFPVVTSCLHDQGHEDSGTVRDRVSGRDLRYHFLGKSGHHSLRLNISVPCRRRLSSSTGHQILLRLISSRQHPESTSPQRIDRRTIDAV